MFGLHVCLPNTFRAPVGIRDGFIPLAMLRSVDAQFCWWEPGRSQLKIFDLDATHTFTPNGAVDVCEGSVPLAAIRFMN